MDMVEGQMNVDAMKLEASTWCWLKLEEEVIV